MTALTTKAAPDCSAEVVDKRPESSAYATPSITLYLQDGSQLYVPPPLLLKSPKLYSLYTQNTYQPLDVSRDVGHVLAHYLFTDTYQCLKPKGSSPHEKMVVEFTTSVGVYAAAQAYELPSLEELAKAEIRRLGDGFRIPLVFDLVRNAYPNPSANDVWLISYLKTRLRLLLENPAGPLEWDLTTERKTVSISDILFRNMLELLRENMLAPRDGPDEAIGEAPEDPLRVRPGPEAKQESYEHEPWEDDVFSMPKKDKKKKKKAETADIKPDPEPYKPEPTVESEPYEYGPPKENYAEVQSKQEARAKEDKNDGFEIWGLGTTKVQKKRVKKSKTVDPVSEAEAYEPKEAVGEKSYEPATEIKLQENPEWHLIEE